MINRLVLRFLKLSDLHRRLICLLLTLATLITAYLGPVRTIASNLTKARDSGRFERVRAELTGINSEFERVGSELKKYGDKVKTSADSVASDPALISAPGIVQIIDTAARKASLVVGALESVESGGAQDGQQHERYRLRISGNYQGLSEFVAILSSSASPLTIVEIAISAKQWSYPEEPLVAELLLMTLSCCS